MNGFLGDRVLAIMAHPDDAELLCMGTLLKARHQGAAVAVVVATDGRFGVSLADAQQRGSEKLPAKLRAEESVTAFLGTGIELLVLDRPDGALQHDRNLISSLEKEFRRFEPTAVISHHIEDSGADHQDHATVGKTAWNIVRRTASVRLFLRSQPLRPDCSFRPNLFVDITDHFQAKMTALQAHRSQHGRVYFDESFHRLRCRQNALVASADLFKRERLLEGFDCPLQITR